MMVLMVTDLPVPVAPAISRCGILARSATTGFPSRSRPSAIGSAARPPAPTPPISSSSRRVTIRAIGLGTSTPTAPLPGIGATRIDGARMVIARSSASATIRPAFTPGAGHHLELGHHRAGGPAGDLALDLEGPERLEQRLPQPVELRLAGVDVLAARAR